MVNPIVITSRSKVNFVYVIRLISLGKKKKRKGSS